MEHWKPVVGYETLYEVSDFGQVRTIKTGLIKTPTWGKDGRQSLLLWKKNKCRLVKVHRLVLLAFKGNPFSGAQACHNDGCPSNNQLDNLRWDTASANQMDRVKHGTSNRGERCAAAKLNAAQVLAIRVDPRLQRIIAKEYGILPNHVSRIKARVRWGHL